MGQVHTWVMTPEQLAEYVKKNPIRATKQPSDARFDTSKDDYKWRPKLAADSRWNNGRNSNI